MSSVSSKEALVEEELYHLIRTVLDKHSSKLNSVEFGRLQPQHSVDGGVADLVLPFIDGKHFLVIECKRKITKPSGIQTLRDFDIFGSNVLNQALNYAVRLGTLAFATTNGQRLALFRTPKAGEPFRIDTHRLMVQDPFKLEEKNVEELLSFLSKWHTGIPVRLIEIDWFFISRLRSFVDFLSKSFKPVTKKLASDEVFSRKFKEFSKKIGGVTSEHLARETAYLLMNKIIFYKILERHYEGLPKLKPISAPDGKYFIEFLKGYFEKAIQVTGDFEPIFITEFYDDIPLPDLDYVFDEMNSFIEEMDTYQLEEIGSDVVGYIYEELIPDEERHRLGQFYTPPPIAELIVKWAVRSSEDVILDPAVGSGTFLVKAYQRLMELKAEKHKKAREQADSGVIHKEILSQLYADDINPFPAHLTSMNLAMRNVLHPTSEMNIIVEDFFNLRSKMVVFAPHVVKTPKGEKRRQIKVPEFDAVIANPPYTRWIEIPDSTRTSLDRTLKKTLHDYGLTVRMRGAVTEVGIYVHFIIHATSFLKNGGRLGMIVSNSWLQSDYGIRFSNFLLDNFKIRAIIDFSNRLFRLPMISTCILLLERCTNEDERLNNNTLLVFLDEDVSVDDLLALIERPEDYEGGQLVRVVNQKGLPRDKKWIQQMFASDRIEKPLLKTAKTVPMNQLFNVYRGNTVWSKYTYDHSLRPNPGPKEFFYLSKDRREHLNLEEFSHPALTSVRYNQFLTFTKDDWNKISDGGGNCYFFICHRPRADLPKNVKEYIKWGETDCKTRVRASRRGGKICGKSWVCAYREKIRKEFVGWYDLGGVVTAPIFAVYHNRYKPRFVMTSFPLALYHATIALVPKVKLNEKLLKALTAYLNSSFVQLYIESHGRVVSVGPIAIELSQATKIPILDITKLSTKQIDCLAELFDRLESKARETGGISRRQQSKELQSIFDELDAYVVEILGLPIRLVESARKMAEALMDRRLSGARLAKPESIRGEEEPRIAPPRKMKKQQKGMADKQLTRWIE